jgi:DNA-binding transcriptional MerR regulator
MEAVRETVGIGEAARALGLSVDTLRYYERAGLLDGVLRTEGNQRRYDDEALTAVNFITKMRASGMSIRNIRRYVELVRSDGDTLDVRRGILEEHRAAICRQMAELQGYLEIVDLKIDLYHRRVDMRGDDPCAVKLAQRLATASTGEHK